MQAGVFSITEANLLEQTFLEMVDWKLTFDEADYQYYEDGLKNFFDQPLPQITKDVIDNVITTIQSLPSDQNSAEEMRLEVGLNVQEHLILSHN